MRELENPHLRSSHRIRLLDHDSFTNLVTESICLEALVLNVSLADRVDTARTKGDVVLLEDLSVTLGVVHVSLLGVPSVA